MFQFSYIHTFTFTATLDFVFCVICRSKTVILFNILIQKNEIIIIYIYIYTQYNA